MNGKFTRYQVFVLAVLAFLQFTIVLDFMIMSPLGAALMPALGITTGQFGGVVSAYAFSAGAAGFLAAGFADRFDRKQLLLVFYAGFLLGTLGCGLATTYEALLAARMVTGIFGGVIGSTVFAITTDLFPPEMRGRVMGTIQTSFAASQVLGIPIGLFLSNHYGWHAPFLMIVGIGAVAGVVIFLRLEPVNAHLAVKSERSPLRHLAKTISNPLYLQTFIAMALLSTGGFMIMPFSSAFSVNNVGVPLDKLPIVYMVTGACSIIGGPMIGRLSDSIGKFRTFTIGTAASIVMVLVYTHLGVTPIWGLTLVSVLMFLSISARMISVSALVAGIPAPQDRGAFTAVSSSLQQLSGGVGAAIGGLVVVQTASGAIQHFDDLGFVVVGAMVLTLAMIFALVRKLGPPAPAMAPAIAAPVAE